MVTVSWGQGLSEDGRETFDSVEQTRAMLEHDTDLSPEELDRLFETGRIIAVDGRSFVPVAHTPITKQADLERQSLIWCVPQGIDVLETVKNPLASTSVETLRVRVLTAKHAVRVAGVFVLRPLREVLTC
jgi:hypothetical protein